MGCISSKAAWPEEDDDRYSPPRKSTGPGRIPPSSLLRARAFGPLEKINEEPEEDNDEDEDDEEDDESVTERPGSLRYLMKGPSSVKKSVFSLKFGRLSDDHHASSAWPDWLSAAAGEAIDGWLPMKSDRFKRLEKIGQGTYSTVYRARDMETGKTVALKKIRFDNLQPQSIRFMAREITILRRLNHPNIMKLEGIITSKVSSYIFLVFEYMEHDLAGLLSCPEVKFTESQIKCYMQQLLSGIQHCHDRGILHRDIKTSNILINNKGILKIADFGLANFMNPKNKQSLTSRVVTLWYRSPELLLGETEYGEGIDMWSVGCVFGEIFLGKPLMKGRTEVEQLHKIFKLCGSPSDDFWNVSKLPHANMFRPYNTYESTLRERCKEFPRSAVSLIQIFLSIDPKKRGTATSALESKYFSTLPYACEPGSLPKYQPNKEIDAKYREEEKRKKSGSSTQVGSRIPRRGHKTSQKLGDFFNLTPTELEADSRSHGGSANVYRRRGGISSRSSMKQSYDTLSDASQKTDESQGSHQSSTRSVPILGFAGPKRHTQRDLLTRLHSGANRHPTSRSRRYDESNILSVKDTYRSYGQKNEDSDRIMHWEQESKHRPDSFGLSDQEMHEDNGNKRKKGKVMFSDEVTSRQHNQAHQLQRKSRFYEDV